MMWKVQASRLKVQKWKRGKEENDSKKQVQSIEELSDAIWSERSKEAGSSGANSEVFPVWRGGT